MAQSAGGDKPVFDASLIYMAINVLEEELEQADCFGNIQYSEIQENFVAKRRVLQRESLRSDWFKVLRSGEVLLTLFRMSHKVRNILEKCNCPLQPVLKGSEQSSWQRLRVQFRCNWQSLYSIIDYLRQYFPVKVDGLDPSGKVIVDCAEPEMARTIAIGALTQCFVLLGKPAAALDPASCQHQPPAEDSNNNASNPAKSTVLQPKVNRLSNKKRVICIYDTTTSEDSDRASIDATPIDNRNSTDVQQQQQQPQHQPHVKQESQNQLQQKPNVSYADSSPDSVLRQVLLRLDEVKALLTANGLTCQSCRQRVHEAAAAVVAAAAVPKSSSNAAADKASDSASVCASGSTPPPQPRQSKNVHSLAIASVIPTAPIPHVAAPPAAAVLAAPPPPQPKSAADAAAKPSRRRTIRKLTTKRQAVQATKLVSDLHAIPGGAPDAVSNTLHRSRTRESAKSVDADNHSTQLRNAKKTEKSGGKQSEKAEEGKTLGNRVKVLVKRHSVRSKSGSKEPLPQGQDVLPLVVNGSAAEQRAPDVARHRAGSSDNRKKLAPPQPQPQGVAPVSGANTNNDIIMKPITTSTVQDLINKLQAVINENA